MTRRSVETLVHALNTASTRYLIVGGLAVVAHGHLRFTADVDLVLDPEPAAIARALEALARLGYSPRVAVELMDFARADERARWRQEKGMLVLSLHSAAHPATEVDLFLESPFDFEPAWARGLVAEVGPGLPARFVSLADLRAMKRASGRAVDRLDLAALERLHPEDLA